MKSAAVLIGILALAAAEDQAPDVTVESVRATLASARPLLTRLTEAEWPEDLSVTQTDLAGLRERLLVEFRLQVRALHPERSPASREHLAGVLAAGLARTFRVRYDPVAKTILVAPGNFAFLPDGLDSKHALTWITVRQAAFALDAHSSNAGRDAPAAEDDDEELRARRMVVEGRAEHLARQTAPHLGAPAETGAKLASLLEHGERVSREWGRRFAEGVSKSPSRALAPPPTTTTGVFHPGRPGSDPGDVTVPGRDAGFTPVSELLLRIDFEERIGATRTADAFEGYLAGASSEGTRFVFAFTDEDSARAFLGARAAFRGAKAGELTGEWVSPVGRRLAYRLDRDGRLVTETLSPTGE